MAKFNYKVTIISTIAIVLLSFTDQSDFLAEQSRFIRVRTAINEKKEFIEKTLNENQISIDSLNLLLIAYKDNDLLDVYAKAKQKETYKKILSYKICARSGQLGPKRREGDGQVPEGFYHLNYFNPTSNFYLSLGINYPNLADRRKSTASDLGGNIFIHGSCVTIGCLPMTDECIKEIYLLAVYARNNGQLRIPVYIFPFKMTDQNMTIYKSQYRDNEELVAFWDNLKVGYDLFFNNFSELNIRVAENGDYIF